MEKYNGRRPWGRTTFFAALAFAFAVGSVSRTATASTTDDPISYSGETEQASGQGFGTILTLLTLHNNGSEYGSVAWNGSSDVLTQDATNTSATRTIAELNAIGIFGTSNFALMFNSNQTGVDTSIGVNSFTVTFFDSAGNTLKNGANDITALFTPGPPNADTSHLEPISPNGQGSAGQVFHVNLSAADAAIVFGNTSNRVGQFVTSGNALTNSNDGADGWSIANSGVLTPVPEPATFTMALGAIGMLSLLAIRRRARAGV